MTPKDNTNPLSPTSNYIIATTSTSSTDSTEEIIKQRLKLDRVHRILNTLSLFEESSAECIQEMLVHFSNQSYQEGVMQADKFIGHIEALYCGLDSVEARLVAVGDSTGMSPVKGKS